MATVQPTVQAHPLADDGVIPNSRLPLLVYPQVLALAAAGPQRAAHTAEQTVHDHGWGAGWRNGIYPFPHYHSTAHEVLVICAGTATVQFGGAAGVRLEVATGDAVVIPAGVAHQRLAASADLLVVGAYPPRQRADLCYARRAERAAALQAIAALALPTSDPLAGADGPLLRLWPAAAGG